ncbi:MAG: diaminopimelate epimerase [Myxococcales bacterium]|nr:diaminopimelate epimerase [Myxococcales bacterium]
MSVDRMYKYEGLGNDFIVIERPRGLRDDAADATLARALCDRHFGVGADGLLFVDPEQPSMHVVNADGSVPEMCGNGLRCVALHYARHEALSTSDLIFDVATGAGPHTCRVERGLGATDEAWITVEMAVPSLVPAEVPTTRAAPMVDAPTEVGEHTLHLTSVSMGNPHAVTFDALGADPRALQLALGPLVQALPIYPRGVNVSFVQPLDVDGNGVARHFKLDVLERGAGWTLACGTGACAAGVAAVLTGRAQRHQPLRFDLPGGPLEITVSDEGARVRMRGPARLVFEFVPSGRFAGLAK